MSRSIMLSRRFAPLFWTQFLSAFNDNFLKNALIALILFQLTVSAEASMISLAGAVFIAPFVLLSALGGEIADRFDKAAVAQRLKFAEIGAAGVAVAGMAFASVPVLLGALFLFGVISALFGPIKYGILPDHLEPSELPKANALIEGATFLAILGGTVGGGLILASGAGIWLFAPVMMVLAVACWAASRKIPPTGSAAPDLRIDANVVRSTGRLIAELRRDGRMWITGLAVSWFWLMGALFLTILPPLVKTVLGGTQIEISAFLALFAVAIGAGSAFAAWLNGPRIILLSAPLAALLMAVFGLDLAVALAGFETGAAYAGLLAFAGQDGIARIAVDLAGLAAAGGLLVVPTFAAVQNWAGEDRRARVVAAVNALSALFMAAGSAAMAGLQYLGLGPVEIVIALSVLNLGASVWMIRRLPSSPVRDLLALLFRLFHRLEIEGLENLEKAGPNPILALNHVSLIDAPVAMSLTERDPVFAIDTGMAANRWVKPFLRFARALPIDPTNPMATRTLIHAVDEGHPLVIFPEGRITVTGSLMKVYDGVGLVADKADARIVPVRIEGLERSMFSRMAGAWSLRRLFPKVKVSILEPVTLDIDPAMTGQQRRRAAGVKLYDTMSDLVFRTTLREETILEAVVRAGRRFGPRKTVLEDPVRGRMTYAALATAARVLGAKIARTYPDQPVLGLMLPNANAAAASVLGIMSAGKVPAMINFTAGPANILAGCRPPKRRSS